MHPRARSGRQCPRRWVRRSASAPDVRVSGIFSPAFERISCRSAHRAHLRIDAFEGLEKIFQTRVHQALTQIGVPSAEDIAALSERVDALSAHIEKTGARTQGRQRAACRVGAKFSRCGGCLALDANLMPHAVGARAAASLGSPWQWRAARFVLRTGCAARSRGGIIGRKLTDYDVYVGVSFWLVRGCGSGEWLRHRRHGAMFIEEIDAVAPVSGNTDATSRGGVSAPACAAAAGTCQSRAPVRARPLRNLWPAAIGHSPSCFRPRCSTTDRRNAICGRFLAAAATA